MTTRRMKLLRALSLLVLVGVLGAPLVPSATAKRQAGPVKGRVQAYHAKVIVKERKKGHPTNKPIPYKGPKLKVQAALIGRDAAEPTIGVLPDGTAFFAAGTFDGGGGNLARTEIYRSVDGGLEWESVQPEIAPGQHESPQTLDPYVYTDTAGKRVFSIDLYTVSGSYLLWSDDKGETWSRNPLASAGWSVDHQTFYSGPPPEGFETNGYPAVLYYCTNRVADVACTRSLDGGLVWTPTGEQPYLGEDEEAGGFCGGLHGHAAVDTKGRLFLPKGHCGAPWVAMSEDMGATWTRTRVAKRPGTSGPHIEMATDAEDNVYVVWWSDEKRLPYLAISRDHGATWSKPMMIAPPGVHQANFPTIAAGDRGRIAILFPGSTSKSLDDQLRPWNDYLVTSKNALSKNPLFVSTTVNEPNDPVRRGSCSGRCGGMFDFLDIFISPLDGAVWAAISDTCEDLCVRATTGTQKQVGTGIAVKQLSGPSMWAPNHKR